MELVLKNDAGSGNNSTFSNVKIYEGSCGALAREVVSAPQRITPILGDTTEDGYAMRLYPNPLGPDSDLNVLMITKDVFNYEIRNITGQLIRKGTVSDGKIEVSALRTGVYFLQVVLDNQVISKRFVKL